MSQQEMHYDEIDRDRAGSSYAGYEGVPHFNYDYSAGSYGQKLSGRLLSSAPTAGQRLVLALVSIVMLMIMTFGLIWIGIATNGDALAGFLLFFLLILFYAAVVIINIVFNRRR
jgi:hypothetical protein